LTLKRASASRSSGEWNDDDFDVLADGLVVGRIFKANAAPVDAPWMWTLAFGHTRTARRRTAMRLRAKLRWQRSLKAGDESDFSHRHRSLSQSSSASRFAAGPFGFFMLI
jgi:hypothetical protein